MIVVFPIEYVPGTQLIAYPDDKAFFSNTADDGNGNLIAEYSGAMVLTEFTGTHPDDAVHMISNDEVMDRFTDMEMAKILTAAKTDIATEVMIERVKRKPMINIRSQRFIDAVNAFEAAGLLDAPGRAAEILQ